MTIPIPNCPQPETPIRERAWADGQRPEPKYSVEEVRAIAAYEHGSTDKYVEIRIGMLAAYADLLERIEADEVAADYPECSGDPSSCLENEGHGCCKPNPPAQAAQVAQGEAVAKVRHFDYSGIARNDFSQEAQMLDGAPVLPDGTLLYTTPPAQPAERVAEGWVLVPKEPTEAMLGAAMQREDDEPLSDWGKMRPAPHAEIYKAMITAAQQADRAEPCNRDCDCAGPCKMGADR